ncbi:MAG: EAL domain-containing response regulator [Sideroxydans sp.]|nr:EAL domain-containing response regulator [Sideroxydans sp.]
MKELHVMVIEDHNFQRKMVVHMLHTLGIKMVWQANNGKQALALLDEKQARSVEVVLCDLDMPEMDGMEFFRHLSKLKPGISVIILSGMEDAVISSVKKMAGSYGLNLLGAAEKPATLEQLKLMLDEYHCVSPNVQQYASTLPASFTLEDILRAVREHQFEPFLQPKVEIKTGRIIGAEALARWRHPQLGIIAPYAFIPLLEASGNMEELTFQMLKKTAQACRRLNNKGFSIDISINLSLSSLSDTTLADRITRTIVDAGVDPHHIILEITESAAMTNVAEALENLTRLRIRGFGLSIDDYGTGFSSMQQLSRVPFTELKIDKSFVTDCDTNHSLRVIVESSIELAHKLKVRSVAEGVEKQEEWDMLKSMKCDEVQGYFIAKPMDVGAFILFCEAYAAVNEEEPKVAAQCGVRY